jgi:ATP-binding cassette subfamily B protein
MAVHDVFVKTELGLQALSKNNLLQALPKPEVPLFVKVALTYNPKTERTEINLDERIKKVVPGSIRSDLKKRGINCDDICYAVKADMTSQGELRNTYLLLTNSSLIFAVSDYSGEMVFSGFAAQKQKYHEGISELYEYPVSRLSHPKILDQVVGGLFVVSIDGLERWICRFSGARMREMHRFCKVLECKLANKEIPAEKEDKPECCPKCGMLYPERGRAVCPKCMVKRAVFFRILSYFKPYKVRIIILFFCMVLTGILNSITPYLTGTVLYDKVLNRDQSLTELIGLNGDFVLALLILVLSIAFVQLIQQLVGVIQGRINAFIVPSVVSKIKGTVFEALQKLSISFFTSRQTGSLMERVNGDANEVMTFFIDGLPYLLYNVFTFLFAAIFMFNMDWRLALVSFFLLPPLFFISYKLMPRMWHANGKRSRTIRSLYSLLNDGIGGARVVRAFGQENYENFRFSKVNENVRNAEMRVVRYGNKFEISFSLAREIPTLLVWSLGAVFIINSPGVFTYGKLITFVNYLHMMQGPMHFFSSIFRWWSSSMNAAQRIFEIIDSKPDVVERDNPLDLDIKGDITFNNVSFGYEPNKKVLKNISFSVKQGEMLGIVGKSGAGKSTLVNLISRLYDAESGEILLDGVNIKDISFKSLHGAVAMVSQETYIFMGTIAENIAYARPDATRNEIVNAAKAASAHSFISRLPDGYDTIIGSGGRELSGGERQRISIARAILANPKILVLDEATASVDTQTERAIQESLEKLVRGRTTISIAHRLSTLRNADYLIVLNNGEIVEKGTHDQLITAKGEYYKLLQLQTKALAMRGIGD